MRRKTLKLQGHLDSLSDFYEKPSRRQRRSPNSLILYRNNSSRTDFPHFSLSIYCTTSIYYRTCVCIFGVIIYLFHKLTSNIFQFCIQKLHQPQFSLKFHFRVMISVLWNKETSYTLDVIWYYLFQFEFGGIMEQFSSEL